MTIQPNYKKTLIACYLGFITQAISANFIPLLFLTFKSTYGISLEKIALIPFVGILISVVLYAMGSGLIKVLISPICYHISSNISCWINRLD